MNVGETFTTCKDVTKEKRSKMRRHRQSITRKIKIRSVGA